MTALAVSGGILVLLALAAGLYCWRCTHYWQGPLRRTRRAGFCEKDARLPAGGTIHYAEGPDNGPALLLIHGQTGCWEDYCPVLPQLGRHWHVFAVDCFGHGQSSRCPDHYGLRAHGEALIWFIQSVIGQPTVVSGHSSGALLAAYAAAYGGPLVHGAVLEDPPVFSTEPAFFPISFAYQDTYAPLHQYRLNGEGACWESYYLRHCLWGRLYLPAGVPEKLASYAQRYATKHPGRPVQFFFLPASLNRLFLHLPQYDPAFGEMFYDYTWHSGISHQALMADIHVPVVFLHCRDAWTPDGTLLAAASDQQARLAVSLIGDCQLITCTSPHDIHQAHPDIFLQAVGELNSKLSGCPQPPKPIVSE